ncbi:ABC transporter ATP-binding protein, partial [Cylindrospermopsis raciborskii LB2897]|nr:ABC transporter ATP-binding protein [Cylindrospermopsis raciborskii LB2897]
MEKSSLLRALAGLWKSGTGTIVRPDLSEILFLPQRPYMILGTLTEQLIYPYNYTDIKEEKT